MTYNNQKIVKRIAELEGIRIHNPLDYQAWLDGETQHYDPINNAGQAMELLEKDGGCLQIKGDYTHAIIAGTRVYDNDWKSAICLAYLASMGQDLTQFEESPND